MRDQETRAALDRDWAASDVNDSETGAASITRTPSWNTRSQASERAVDATYRAKLASQPSKKRFVVRRIIGLCGSIRGSRLGTHEEFRRTI